MKPITEDKIEIFAVETLKSMGWEYMHGLAMATGAEQAKLENFEQIGLIQHFQKTT